MATKKGKSVMDWENAADSSTPTVFYRTLNVEGLEIFYREAGPWDWLSRPMELHHRPLAEPSVRLSPHSAPIRQTCRPHRVANVRRDPAGS
jgi:hypothetical protein